MLASWNRLGSWARAGVVAAGVLATVAAGTVAGRPGDGPGSIPMTVDRSTLVHPDLCRPGTREAARGDSATGDPGNGVSALTWAPVAVIGLGLPAGVGPGATAHVKDNCPTCVVSPSAQPQVVLLMVETVETSEGDAAVQQATLGVMSQLGPNDRVASLNPDGSGLLLQPTRIGDIKNPDEVVQQVVNIGDPGGYNDAFLQAEEALKNRPEVKQVVIIGDGDASPPDPGVVERMVSEGFITNAIGVNIDSNPDYMDGMRMIAERGRGRYLEAADAGGAASLLARSCG